MQGGEPCTVGSGRERKEEEEEEEEEEKERVMRKINRTSHKGWGTKEDLRKTKENKVSA